jgi:hypothetical protein
VAKHSAVVAVRSAAVAVHVQKVEAKKNSITPLVESLSGVIDLPAGFDYKKEYRDYLGKKYN